MSLVLDRRPACLVRRRTAAAGLAFGALAFAAPVRLQPARPAPGTNGMVVSTNRLAAEAGLRVLQDGGNAIDAAVAVGFTLAVVEPQNSGVGGKGEMLIYDARSRKVRSLDFSGVMPAGVRDGLFNESNREAGVLSAAIPGNVAGWTVALDVYGTKPLAVLMEPAIEYAEKGFPLSSREVRAIASSREKLARFPTSARVFLPGGGVPREGDRLIQGDLARTLKAIAAGGARAFYHGPIAQALVTFSREHGGVFTEADFAAYKPHWEDPISTTYRGYEVFCSPAPSFGPALLQWLNVLELYDLASLGRNSADALHLSAEAAKLAASDALVHIGDPAFMKAPAPALISKAHAARQRARIDAKRAAVKVLPSAAELRGSHTTAFSVADREGNVVSVIQTLNAGFGSGVVFGNTGVLLNNNMQHVRRDGPNRAAAGKRIRHPSVPAMVMKDGKPVLSVGGAGGLTIWLSVAQAITNVVDFRLDALQSVSSPRFTVEYGYYKAKPGLYAWDDFTFAEIAVEPDIAPGVRQALAARGHVVKEERAISTVNALQIDPKTGLLRGGADARGGGHVAAW